VWSLEGDFVGQHVELVAGKGDRVRFWHNVWCGETPLKTLFPMLFSCSSNKTASIELFFCSSNKTASIESLIRPVDGEGRVWNFSFNRDFND
jgi:hypothetical protein